MELLFLGTGAADWHGTEPDYRRFTATLVDNTLMLDASHQALELMPEGVLPEILCFTHSHRDHFCLETVRTLATRRREAGLAKLLVAAEKSWISRIDVPDAELLPLTPLVPFAASGYSILPLPANHETDIPEEQPLHYLVEKDGKRLLYATDGAWMLRKAVTAMGKTPLDAMVIDATIGDGHDGDYRVFEHNSLPMIRVMVRTFLDTGLLPEGAPVYLTHMARTLHPDAKTLAASLTKPLTATYDGLRIRI